MALERGPANRYARSRSHDDTVAPSRLLQEIDQKLAICHYCLQLPLAAAIFESISGFCALCSQEQRSFPSPTVAVDSTVYVCTTTASAIDASRHDAGGPPDMAQSTTKYARLDTWQLGQKPQPPLHSLCVKHSTRLRPEPGQMT